MQKIISLTAGLLLTTAATAEDRYGEWEGSYGSVTIEPNIANPSLPTHFVILRPQEGSRNSGPLVLRCKNDKTEAFYGAAEFEFFGIGRRPALNVRFASETKSSKIQASGSAGMGDAAFIDSPINFITRLLSEEQVVLSGDYYSGTFVGLFKIDEVTAEGVYELANTCGWINRLPVRQLAPSIIDEATAAQGAQSEIQNQELLIKLQALIDQYGIPSVSAGLNSLATR